MTPEIMARIEADMASTKDMDLPELLGFLSHYSTRFSNEIREGLVTLQAIRAHGDEILERMRTTN